MIVEYRKKLFYILFFSFSFIFFLYVIKLNINNVVKNSGWFNLEKVDIRGLKYIKKESILGLLPFSENTNIFDLNFDVLKKKIEVDNRIQVVKIQTKFPNKLIITLREVYGDYIILLDNKDYYDISKDMKIISMNDKILDHDKIIFSITSAFLKKIDIDLNQKLLKFKKKVKANSSGRDIIKNSFFLKRLVKTVDSFKRKDFLNIISVIYFNPKSYAELYMRNKKQRIFINGSFQINDLKKARFAYIYGNNMDKVVKTIDLRNGIVKYIF